MRKSKWQLLGIAVFVLFVTFLCGQVPGTDLFVQSFLIVSLFFAALAGYKFYRDYKLSQGRPMIRETHAYYREPDESPELMSRDSRGLPTHFD